MPTDFLNPSSNQATTVFQFRHLGQNVGFHLHTPGPAPAPGSFASRGATAALPGACCETTDNDYADYVFEVRAEATTPTLAPSFGALKLLYRD